MTTKIVGTGCYIPEFKVTNDDLEKIVNTSDEWISSRTGIKERHITEKGTTYMAAEAAKNACENAGVNPEDIDLIILATTTADHYFPSGACEVQNVIGSDRAAAFDLSAACSGFIFALNTAHSFISSGIYKTCLVIGADAMSKVVDWTDRSTCVLFGDGAGAVVVKGAEQGLIHMEMGSDGSRGMVLSCRNRDLGYSDKGTRESSLDYIHMDGQEVFKFAVRQVSESLKSTALGGDMDLADVKYFILHQANKRIIDAVAKKVQLPLERFPINLMNYGNTSAASVPIVLDELNRSGQLEEGDILMLSGFGGGLTWGTTLLAW